MDEINETIKQLKNDLKKYIQIDDKILDEESFNKLIKENEEKIRSDKNGN